ncbi:MAG: PLP-dependent aminotransferase family protein [Janthinobacterium lividum]
MDVALLVGAYARSHASRHYSQQRILYEALRDAILRGELKAGIRLASSRSLADTLRIARNSVLYAYERLAEEGLVEANRQGSRVSRVLLAGLSGSRQREALDTRGEAPPHLPARRSGKQRVHLGAPPDNECTPAEGFGKPRPPGIVDRRLSPGLPALDAFPVAAWRRAVNRAWQHGGEDLLSDADVDGHPALRAAIADDLRIRRGLRCTDAQVFITDGTQNSVEACVQALLRPADTVWFENPGYTGARRIFAAAGMRVEAIPVDGEGMAPGDTAWQRTPPRMVFVTPSHQYPLGSVLSLSRRAAFIAQARSHRSWIIEDDYDSEFRHDGDPLPALQGLADAAPVIYLGTFSKTLFPAMRMAFMVVPQALCHTFSDGMRRMKRHARTVDQIALADFIAGGAYARHLRSMKRLYALRRHALIEAVTTHLGDGVTVGDTGGMHVTVRLNVPVRDIDVARAMAAIGVDVSSLSRSYSDLEMGSGAVHDHNGFVLGFANLPEGDAMQCVAALAAVIRGMASSSGRDGIR